MTNKDRADNAQAALEAYAKATHRKENDRDWSEIMRDLIGDMMHFARQNALDFEQESTWARGNFEDECAEESVKTCVSCGHECDDDCNECGSDPMMAGDRMCIWCDKNQLTPTEREEEAR